MLEWTDHERLNLLSKESCIRFNECRKNPNLFNNLIELRKALLDFIADFSNWDNSTKEEFLNTSRNITISAHQSLGGLPDTRPVIADPFAGGGSIPLEALRVGADAYASDLNPIPVLLNKVVLEYIPKYGKRLTEEFQKRSLEIGRIANEELKQFYPDEANAGEVSTYIWYKTILSEAPDSEKHPIELPLIRSLWLAKGKNRNLALRWIRNKSGGIITRNKTITYANGKKLEVREPLLEIFSPEKASEVESGTSKAGAATCPITGYTTPVESVRRQLVERKGGASDSRLGCVVYNDNSSGKKYRIATDDDLKIAINAQERLGDLLLNTKNPISLLPDGRLNHLRGFFNVVIYGMTRWCDIFSPRQSLTLSTYSRLIREVGESITEEHDQAFSTAVLTVLAMALGRQIDYGSSLCVWASGGEFVCHTFGRQALPMVWDFAETNPLSGVGWKGACEWVRRVIETTDDAKMNPGEVVQGSALNQTLPTDSVDATISDPPYYAAIPYADLSDFFYGWLKRTLGTAHPDLFKDELSPKEEECVSLSHRAAMYRHKDGPWFESKMALACSESNRVTKPSGIGVYVFANKETQGWEAMLGALIGSGWIITGSWPIDTERGGRLRALNSAALASSVHLVCRPRQKTPNTIESPEIGDWSDVLQELPKRIHEWMPRLSAEGVVGADAIFACIGPALEIFSRYTKVEKPNGDEVMLKEYLEHIWAAVSKEAISVIFSGADTDGFEPDARLTAMWLWTITGGKPIEDSKSDESSDSDDEEESKPKNKVKGGFVLEFDAARKIAQGLGADLTALANLVEVSGETARLLPVAERTSYLFGKDQADNPSAGRKKKKSSQMDLFAQLAQEGVSEETWAEKTVSKIGVTNLDRIHQAMILFAAGRSEAMKRFLVDDGAGRDPKFWSLAQALSALYPTKTDEKRWVDGVLARKKGLGL